MTYVANRICHDADSHVMETREWLDPYLDAAVAGKLRPIYGSKPNRIDKMLEQAKSRKSDEEADAKARENPIAGPKGWMAYGAFDPVERKKVLDELGFSSQLVFPTSSLGPALRAKEEDAFYAGVRAHNLAMGAFCESDPRLIGVAYVPLNETTRALEETRAALDAGCGAVQVFAGPAGERSPGHTDLDPFWELLSSRRVPFMLHIGPGTMTQPRAFHDNGRERAPDLHGGGENLRFPDYVMLSFAPQIFLTALIYDGVFERFPDLRGGVIESGAGWVPGYLQQLDFAHRGFRRTDPYVSALTLKPSEYLRRAVKFTPFPGEDVGEIIRQGGDDLFMFSSDYPHPEGTNDPLGRFERYMEGFDEDVKDRFYRRNFEQMMGMSA
jgi:uncharacterized protein